MLVKTADLPDHLEKDCKCRQEICEFCKQSISLNKMKVKLLFFICLNHLRKEAAHSYFHSIPHRIDNINYCDHQLGLRGALSQAPVVQNGG